MTTKTKKSSIFIVLTERKNDGSADKKMPAPADTEPHWRAGREEKKRVKKVMDVRGRVKET